MSGPTPPAILILSQRSLPTARRIADALPGARIHGLAGRTAGADEPIDGFAPALRDLFAAGTPIVALCAAGIVIRCLAPLLADKRGEPPVLAVAEDGSAVVPLLGGLAGVNRLARRIGAALDVAPALTISGDLEFGVALEDPPAGYSLADPELGKQFMADLLAGASVRIEEAAPVDAPAWLAESRLPLAPQAEHRILVTPFRTAGAAGQLVYHPACAVVTAAPGTASEDIAAAIDAARLTPEALAALLVPETTQDAAWLDRLEAGFACPIRLVDKPEGAVEGTCIASGPAVTIRVARQPVDASRIGRDRGRLAVVGLGPGAAEWLTPEARACLLGADVLYGYGPYLEQARRLMGRAASAGQNYHASDNQEELDRAGAALAEAARGRAVAIVSSGDPGIFAMAAALFEILDGQAEASLVRIRILPGITAAQAAAARSGAPLGHDFCILSLSDRLKPWAVIERRLEAAGAADLVLALYNPISRARPWQLARAREILLGHRAADTPVLLARAVGRAGETHRTVTLGTLDAADVDMATLVIVGSSETRTFEAAGRRWTYTPRHYGRMDPA